MTAKQYPDSYGLFDSENDSVDNKSYPESFSLFDENNNKETKQSKSNSAKQNTKFPDSYSVFDEKSSPEASSGHPGTSKSPSNDVGGVESSTTKNNAFKKGLSESASGLIANKVFGGNEQQLVQRAESDPSFWESLVKEGGTITGDLPYMAAGATLGAVAGGALGSVVPGLGTGIGSAVGGAFGATALPAFLKESIRQYNDFQASGGDLTFGEFLERADQIADTTLSQGSFGVILGTLAKAGPLLEGLPGVGQLFKTKISKAAGTLGAEVAAAGTIPSAVQGRLPEGEDYAKALAVLGGFKLAQLPSAIRDDIQKQGQSSGKSPEEFAKSYSDEQLDFLKDQTEEPAQGTNTENIGLPGQGKTLDEAVSFEPLAEPKKSDMSKGAAFRTAVVDELYPLEKYVTGTGVADLPISQDPYKQARLFRGWSGKASTFLDFKPFDPDTLTFKGKGFREIIKPYKEDLQGLSKYLVAKRAVELNKQGKETGIDLNDANAYVREHAKKYESARKDVRQFQNNLLNYAEKSGLVSPETAALWRELNENYVPFQRVLEESPEEFFGKSMQPKNPFYRLKGSERRVIDPLESIIGNTYTIIRASEQNRLMKTLVEFDKKHRGAGEFIDLGTSTTEESNLKSFFEYMKGEDAIGEDYIKYLDNGKFRKYKVPKDIAETLKGLKSEQIPFWGQLFAYPTRLVRAGSITLSAGTLAKLATVDQLEAFIYTDVGYVPYIDLARGLFNAIKKPELYHQWKASGGDQSLVRELSRNFKRNKLSKVAGKIDKSEFKSLDGALRAFEAASRPLEEATRISVFEKALKRKGMSPDDLREAAYQAREATLDYAKRGSRTKFLSMAIPFFSSAVNGSDKFIQEARKHPKKVIPKAIAAITLPTLLLYYNNKDRKDYQELPEWEKDKYWHFFIDGFGDKPLHFRLAKGYELGTVFGTIPERLAEYADSQDKDNLVEIPKALWETFTPALVPAAVQPLIETYSNKKMFSGGPVVPERLKRLPPEEQFQPYTSSTAKAVGKLLSNVPFVGKTAAASPIVIEHWLSSFTGSTGNRLVEYTEKALRKTGVIAERIDPEKELSDYPVLKEFFGKRGYTAQAASISKFYKESDKLTKQNAAINRAKKEGRFNDVQRLSKGFNEGLYRQSNRIRRGFAKSNSAIRNILLDGQNYTSSEKKVLIDQLVVDMVNVSRSFLGKESD